MRRSGYIRWGEVKVGGLLAGAFLIFLWASFHVAGPSLFGRRHMCRVYFPDVAGVVAGAPVRLGGVSVGVVKHVSFDEFARRGAVRLDLSVSHPAWRLLHQDARAALGTVGVLGDAMVTLTPGSPGAPPLADGGEVQTLALSRLADLAPRLDAALGDFQDAARGITSLAQSVREGSGTIGRLISSSALHDSLVTFAAAGARASRGLDRSQTLLVGRLGALALSLDTLVAEIRSPAGSTGRLLADATLFESLSRIAFRLDSLSAALGTGGGGAAGALLRDRALYDRTTRVVAEAESLVAEVRRHPSHFFRFSVF